MNNKRHNIAINGLATIMIFGLLLYLQRIIPFGENSFLTTDLNSQYVNFFSYLKLIFDGDKSIFYSFSKALGGGMESLYSYYLLSPFNVIFAFFKLKDIELAITVLCAAKLFAISTTSYIYFCKVSGQGYSLFNMAFSLAFTFSAFNIVYMQNIMWLDVVMALPLVLLGIEKLISEQDNKLFVVALVYAMITNFYLSFMVCLFSCLYIGYRLFSQSLQLKDVFKRCTFFCYSGILSAGISACILLPAAVALQKSFKESNLLSNFFFEIIVTLKDFILQIFAPKSFQWNFLVDGAPNLFCGIIMPVFCILFFTRKCIDKKTKISAAAVTLILAISFFFKGTSLLWHGGSPPIWFLHRHSFLFIFWAIYLAFLFVQTVKKNQYKALTAAFLVINIFTLFIYDMSVFENIRYSKNDIKKYVEEYSPVFDHIKSIDNSKFYRVETTQKRTINDTMLFGYNGISHYSTGDSEVTKTLGGKAGYSTTLQWIQYSRGSSLAIDSLMGIKYILSPYQLSLDLEKIATGSFVDTYQNKYSFPLGFMTNNNLFRIDINLLSPVTFANAVYSGINGHDVIVDTMVNGVREYLHNMKTEQGENYIKMSPQGDDAYIKHTFVAPETSAYYMYVDMQNYPYGNVSVANSNQKFPYFHSENSGNVFIGNFEKGEYVEVICTIKNSLKFSQFDFFYTDIEELEYTSTKVNDNAFKITNFKDNKIAGEITVKESNSSLFFTIPYDKGWKIHVDGVKVSPEIALDTFITIPMETGTHKVKMVYYPEYLAFSVIVSLLSIIIFVFQQVIFKKSKNTVDKQTYFDQ